MCGKPCPLNNSEECSGLGACFTDLACEPCCDSVPGCQFFPPGILAKLTALTGFNVLQLTNILGMIQGPEQARVQWWLQANGEPIWAYAEKYDLRGVTIGLYGATTGRGCNDAKAIWTNYGTNYGNQTQAQIIAAVRRIAVEPKWQIAMFDAYITTYWQPTWAMLKARGYTSALTFGAVLDASMNAGLGDDSRRFWGSRHLVRAASANTAKEADFLTLFNTLRVQHPARATPRMGKRVGAWQNLQTLGLWAMDFAADASLTALKGYAFCYDVCG